MTSCAWNLFNETFLLRYFLTRNVLHLQLAQCPTFSLFWIFSNHQRTYGTCIPYSTEKNSNFLWLEVVCILNISLRTLVISRDPRMMKANAIKLSRLSTWFTQGNLHLINVKLHRKLIWFIIFKLNFSISYGGKWKMQSNFGWIDKDRTSEGGYGINIKVENRKIWQSWNLWNAI